LGSDEGTKQRLSTRTSRRLVFIVRARVHKGLSIPTADNQTIRVNNASHDQQELQLARFARQDVSDSNVIRDGGTAVGLSDELGIENSLVRLEFG
jgi:hypothetical protein